MAKDRNRGIEPDPALIKKLRLSKGWTQDDLALAVSCSTRTVRNAEKGNRIDSATMNSIAEAFDMRVSEISLQANESKSLNSRHIEMAKHWAKAYQNSDVEGVLKYHHPDIRLELPGTAEMTGSEVFVGIEAVREHTIYAFEVIKILEVHFEVFDAVEQLVFHRAKTSFLGLKTNHEFTATHLNEIEFKDQRIIRRTMIADLAGYRKGVPNMESERRRCLS